MADTFDRIIAAWKAVLPELDTDYFAIAGRVHNLARHWVEYLHWFAEQHGVGLGEVYVLMALRRAPEPVRPTELYRQLAISSGTITRRVDRLVAGGLVERLVDDADGRSVKVRLTRKGREQVDEHLVYPRDPLLHAIDALPAERRKELIDLLRVVLGGVETLKRTARPATKMPRSRRKRTMFLAS